MKPPPQPQLFKRSLSVWRQQIEYSLSGIDLSCFRFQQWSKSLLFCLPFTELRQQRHVRIRIFKFESVTDIVEVDRGSCKKRYLFAVNNQMNAQGFDALAIGKQFGF